MIETILVLCKFKSNLFIQKQKLADHPPEAVLAQHQEPEVTGGEVYFIHELI